MLQGGEGVSVLHVLHPLLGPVGQTGFCYGGDNRSTEE